jgi:exosortase/archaeosortase family protein
MQPNLSILKKHANSLMKILPIVAFAVPLLWLYFLDSGSFESLWKGRAFQLFFVWLIALELILGWENLQASEIKKFASARTITLILALMLPTAYVIASFYLGLNQMILSSATHAGISFANLMPLSMEYLVFACLFCSLVLLLFGIKGLKDFSVPAFFMAIVGVIYTIDNVYPYGRFTPFQLFVPATASFAAAILSMMGYNTTMIFTQDSLQGSLPTLTATDPNNPLRTARFGIAWPCAGIESFLIFTVTIMLFLKWMPISWKAKLGYFAVGAAVTYLVNVLRIVNIFLIGINGGDITAFHSLYGPLYAVAWIVSYPLIILGSQSLWRRVKKGGVTNQNVMTSNGN